MQASNETKSNDGSNKRTEKIPKCFKKHVYKKYKKLFDWEILQCLSDNYIETQDDDW